MKAKQVILLAILFLVSWPIQAQYAPAGNHIRTSWSEHIDVNQVHSEYPRPLMVRDNWKNLNGLWNYVITDRNTCSPSDFQGQILVPFPLESSLSGVGKTLGADKYLWYERDFTLPSNWSKQRILLHFGAVDWQTDVWVNDIKVGSHTGGYTPFSFDITQALSKKIK
jgi:Beta-galactosidase/beta-glucuronidase